MAALAFAVRGLCFLIPSTPRLFICYFYLDWLFSINDYKKFLSTTVWGLHTELSIICNTMCYVWVLGAKCHPIQNSFPNCYSKWRALDSLCSRKCLVISFNRFWLLDLGIQPLNIKGFVPMGSSYRTLANLTCQLFKLSFGFMFTYSVAQMMSRLICFFCKN